MGRALLILLILAFSVAEADARRRSHRHHYRSYAVVVTPYGTLLPERRGHDQARAMADRLRPAYDRRGLGAASGLVPPTWQLQPPDPNWRGKRFMSPDGTAWLATYTSPAEPEAITAHMRTVAFADGEEIAYLRGERDWIAVSGRKGDRIFYRKAVLACGGRVWRHVAFEYPAEARRGMDRFVRRAADEVDATANEACDGAVSSYR